MELALGFLLGVFALTALACTIFWLWSLVDALRRPDAEWATAGQNRILWVILLLVLGAPASCIYVLVPRPALKAAAG